jgi:hypothetical protein
MQQRHSILEQQIAHLRTLPATSTGWDPSRPTERVLDIARSIAESNWHDNIPIPSMIGTSDGGVHVKWAHGLRRVSAFVFPDESIEYLAVENGQPVSNHLTEGGRLSELLSWLMR